MLCGKYIDSMHGPIFQPAYVYWRMKVPQAANCDRCVLQWTGSLPRTPAVVRFRISDEIGEGRMGPYYGCFQKSWYPQIIHFIGFSTINHPFWGTPIFGNTHILQDGHNKPVINGVTWPLSMAFSRGICGYNPTYRSDFSPSLVDFWAHLVGVPADTSKCF